MLAAGDGRGLAHEFDEFFINAGEAADFALVEQLCESAPCGFLRDELLPDCRIIGGLSGGARACGEGRELGGLTRNAATGEMREQEQQDDCLQFHGYSFRFLTGAVAVSAKSCSRRLVGA